MCNYILADSRFVTYPYRIILILRLTVEKSHLVRYSAAMAPKSLLQQNPHLRNAKDYQRALRTNVLSSMAIEGVKKAAERALSPASGKKIAKAL